MEIIIGSNTVKVNDIVRCSIEKPNERDLYVAEKRCNGSNVHYDEIVPTLTDKIDMDLVTKYERPIAYAVDRKMPHAMLMELPVRFDFHLQFSLSKDTKNDPPRYGVAWKYWGKRNDNSEKETIAKHMQMLYASDLLPAVDYLLTALSYKEKVYTKKQKRALMRIELLLSTFFLKVFKGRFIAPTLVQHNPYSLLAHHFDELYVLGRFSDHAIADPRAVKDLEVLRQQLIEAKAAEDELLLRIQEREAIRQAFFQENAETPVLVVVQNNNHRMSFMENKCGFDIYEKKAEIDAAIAEARKQYLEARKQKEATITHEEKVRKSYNISEKMVERELNWLLSSNPDMFIPIVGDCETRFRYNVIFLRNSNFRDEPQEFDHLLVSPAGIIAIETKSWNDHLIIRPDGKWVRKTDSGDMGIEGPQMQIARHEALLNSIVSDVPIHSILCFTGRNIIVDGTENFTTCPIVLLKDLCDHISKICETKTYSPVEMQQMVGIIERYKFNRQSQIF